VQHGWYDRKRRRIRDLACGELRIYLDVEVRRVACRRCGTVKQERLAFLADNSFYTKRFAFYVGRRCRASPIQDVAKELRLDWHTVEALEQQYMREQLRRAGTPGPRAIGLDEVSFKKGHTYRIIASDLGRQRPIWFGGTDRSGGEPRSVLRVARAPEARPHPPRRDGHVETLSARHRAPRAAGQHPV